jgi:FkbM family methyltransferase
MKNIIYRLWSYSPAQILNMFRHEVTLPNYLPKLRIDPKEVKRLSKMPRYLAGETVLFGKKVYFIDALSYLAMCDEIFVRNNYRFISKKTAPLIVDCGSNIGLSVIYFKLLYPEAKIIAFEPDKKAFLALEKNIQNFGFKNVELNNEAVWTKKGKINFYAEGSWGGRIVEKRTNNKVVVINTIRLSDILVGKVDFLKIDIEGAETKVINDSSNKIKNVENLFVEYHSLAERKQTLSKILSIMSDAGMRYYIREASSRKNLFTDRVLSGFDLQVEIFVYRVN